MAEQVVGTRRIILDFIKEKATVTLAELSEYLRVSKEAVRQQLRELQQQGLVECEDSRGSGRVGRPAGTFKLTPQGEAFFPKSYDALSLTLLDAVESEFGKDGVKLLLRSIVDQKVAAFQPKLLGKTLPEKLQLMRDVYQTDDPYMAAEHGPAAKLVEHNCPFLGVVEQRPELCSVTTNVLRRTLGCEVVREKRFQQGDGCCVFRVLHDRPLANSDFRFE